MDTSDFITATIAAEVRCKENIIIKTIIRAIVKSNEIALLENVPITGANITTYQPLDEIEPYCTIVLMNSDGVIVGNVDSREAVKK